MKLYSTMGFSLLEVVVAMVILSLVVAGAFGLFATAHKLLSAAGHRLEAVGYARMILEQLRVYRSADPSTPAGAGAAFTGGTHNPDVIGLPTDVQTADGVALNWSYTVDSIDCGDVQEVTARVTWVEP